MRDTHRHCVVTASLGALDNRLSVLSRNCKINSLVPAIDYGVVTLQDVQPDDSIHRDSMACIAELGLKIMQIDQGHWAGTKIIAADIEAIDHRHRNNSVVYLNLFWHLNHAGTF